MRQNEGSDTGQFGVRYSGIHVFLVFGHGFPYSAKDSRIPDGFLYSGWIPVYSRWIPVFRMDSRIRYGFRIPSMDSSDSYGFYGRS